MALLTESTRSGQPLVKDLRYKLRTGRLKAGDWLGTEVDFAQSYGISRMTVRRALQPLAAHGLIERRRGKGVFVGRAERASRPRTIQVIVPNLHDTACIQMIQGVRSSVLEKHHDGVIQVFNADRDIQQACNFLRGLPSWGVDGAIIRFLSDSDFIAALGDLKRQQFPLVIVEQPSDVSLPVVLADHYGGSYQACTHALSLGHRVMGFVGRLESSNTRLRLNGLRDAANDGGVAWPSQYIFSLDPLIDPLGDWSEGIQAGIDQLMSLTPRPTVVFFNDDRTAAIGCRRLKNMGLRVPQDVSIVGSGADHHVAQIIDPPLATIQVPNAQIGKNAAELLESRINGLVSENEAIRLPTRWHMDASLTTAPTKVESEVGA